MAFIGVPEQGCVSTLAFVTGNMVLITYIDGVVNNIAGLNGIKIEIVKAAPGAPAKAVGVN